MSSAAAAGDKRARPLEGLAPALEAADHQRKKKRTQLEALVSALRDEIRQRDTLADVQARRRVLEMGVDQESAHERIRRVEIEVERLIGRSLVDDEAVEGDEEEEDESSEPDHESDEESEDEEPILLSGAQYESESDSEEEESKSAPSTPVKENKAPRECPPAPARRKAAR